MLNASKIQVYKILKNRIEIVTWESMLMQKVAKELRNCK